MSEEKNIGQCTLKIEIGDITARDIEAFVFYANHALELGSGFGTAIAVRGGPSVQEELNKMGPLETTQAVVSSAGELKVEYIVHAVGPRFMEEKMSEKLAATMANSLRAAEEKGIKKLAFPPMGTGFYGVPLDLCARVMLEAIEKYINEGGRFEEIAIVLLDNREFRVFQNQLKAAQAA